MQQGFERAISMIGIECWISLFRIILTKIKIRTKQMVLTSIIFKEDVVIAAVFVLKDDEVVVKQFEQIFNGSSIIEINAD